MEILSNFTEHRRFTMAMTHTTAHQSVKAGTQMMRPTVVHTVRMH